MTMENREAAIKECLKWEGGYSNNPSDPGGPTNWGITLVDAQRYWKKNADAGDVKNMPQSIAIDIYRSKYWKTSQYDCDKLEPGVDLAVFDFGVNSGPARAKKYLDKAVGGTSKETINKLCDARLAFLQGLSTWPVFGTGWGHRVIGIRQKALQMASAPVTVTAQNTTAAVVVTSGTAAAMAAPHLMGWILLGTAGVALAVWLGIHFYKKWNTNA